METNCTQYVPQVDYTTQINMIFDNCSGFTNQDLNGYMDIAKKGTTVPEPPLYILVCVSILYTSIFLSGILGNSLVVFVVFMNRDMRNPTNYFLINLSIADLLVIVVCMPSAFMDLYAKEVWYLGAAMCKHSHF